MPWVRWVWQSDSSDSFRVSSVGTCFVSTMAAVQPFVAPNVGDLSDDEPDADTGMDYKAFVDAFVDAPKLKEAWIGTLMNSRLFS